MDVNRGSAHGWARWRPMKGECEMGFDFGRGSKESLSLSLLHLQKMSWVQKMSADVRGLVVCVQSVCVTMALVVPIISKACCLCTVVIEGTSNPWQGNLLHNLLQFWNASESWCLPCKAFWKPRPTAILRKTNPCLSLLV